MGLCGCVCVCVNDGGRGAALWDQMIHSVSKHFKHFFHFEFVTIASTCLKFSAKRTLINVQAVKGATRRLIFVTSVLCLLYLKLGITFSSKQNGIIAL